MQRLFTIIVRQSGSDINRDVKPAKCISLAQAEGRATALLRLYRLTKSDGPLWDAWTVTARHATKLLPVIVAHGNADGTQWTQRDNGWVD